MDMLLCSSHPGCSQVIAFHPSGHSIPTCFCGGDEDALLLAQLHPMSLFVYAH